MSITPYSSLLEKIDRKRLDFDFEKICAVTLSKSNVYCCLTCGKFLQGRIAGSPAHIHSLECEHPLFINLQTSNVYVLPEGYELKGEFDDIKHAIFPQFTNLDLQLLEETTEEMMDLHGRRFLPGGYIGINNIKSSDYINVCLHALIHVKPVCNYLIMKDFRNAQSHLVRSLSDAARRVCNLHPFKALYSPHEFLQAVNVISERRFSLQKQSDPLEFLAWLLNQLDKDLLEDSKLIRECFQGQVQVSCQAVKQILAADNSNNTSVKMVPFYYLSLDLPPTPLYQSQSGEFIQPQVSLSQLLEKYGGGQLTQKSGMIYVYSLEKMPSYLILHFKRFTKAHLVIEKNRTLVNHPLEGLQIFDSYHHAHSYDIISNICHYGDAEPGKGRYMIQLKNPANQHWFEIDDINVKSIPSQTVPMSESFIQIWKRQTN